MSEARRLRAARARERRELDRLAGHHPLRRRAGRVERCVAPLLVVVCLLGIVAGYFAVNAVNRVSGREDPRVTAVTTAAAVGNPYARTIRGEWAADVSWADPAGATHRGHVAVSGDVPIGTKVPARLAADGTVRSSPESVTADVWQMVMVSLGILLVVLALGLICREALGQLADRLRQESWQDAWARWNPTVPDRGGH
jgi:hypothetical protein